MNNKKSDTMVSVRSFVTALVIIAILMILCYVATLLIPCEGIPFWKWILSPVLVLGSSDKVTIIGVIVFLLIIGGTFQGLSDCGVMRYMVDKIAYRYGTARYKLMAVILLFFMSLGSLVGSFEEVVPMVPIVVALAIRLGWDAVTGVMMSLLAVACGFAAGVFNPFTVGLAQTMANLPMFSGAWFRALSFVCIYILLFVFCRAHAKHVDRGVSGDSETEYVEDAGKNRGVKLFGVIVGCGIVVLLSTAFVSVLRDYSFIIISLMFFAAGVASCLTSGMKSKVFWRSFGKGTVSMFPAVIMILMASSIKFTLQTAGAFDYIVSSAIGIASVLPRWAIVLFIYMLVLVMNFLIASGSAKAIMLIPMLVPMAAAFGISPQLVIVAYAFGDGFSNAFYPTNPALLIALGLADTSYGNWFKTSVKFQLANVILTSLLLVLGLAIGI